MNVDKTSGVSDRTGKSENHVPESIMKQFINETILHRNQIIVYKYINSTELIPGKDAI